MDKKKVLFVVNPKSGKDKNRIKTLDVVERFSSEDYDFNIKTTKCSGDATNIVKNNMDDEDFVVCMGGDGTFNETINGVMQLPKRIPIGYIPTGSTNDLATTIGLPSDIEKATDVIVDGHINSYDIGLFNNKFFSYVASFGAASSLSYSTPQKLKNALGHSAYLINGLIINLVPTLKSTRPNHAVIEYDGGVIDDYFSFGSISNSTSVGGIFKFNKDDVKLDDGVFEVILVRKISNPLDSFRMLAKVKRQDYDGKHIIFFRTKNISIKFDKQIPFTLDGEYGGDHQDVRCSVLHKAIDIISPKNPMFIGNTNSNQEISESKDN